MPPTWRRLHLGGGGALFLGVAAPWFVAVSLRNPSFPEFFFVHEHFTRFLTTVHQRVEPWWYFLPLLLLAVLPWLPGLLRACRRAWPQPGADAVRFRALRFLLIYAALTLVFFSASGSKLAPYILPHAAGAGRGDRRRAPRAAGAGAHAARVGAALALLVAARPSYL